MQEQLSCPSCAPKLKALNIITDVTSSASTHHCISRVCQNELRDSFIKAVAGVPSDFPGYNSSTAVVIGACPETIDWILDGSCQGQGISDIIILVLSEDVSQAKDQFRLRKFQNPQREHIDDVISTGKPFLGMESRYRYFVCTTEQFRKDVSVIPTSFPPITTIVSINALVSCDSSLHIDLCKRSVDFNILKSVKFLPIFLSILPAPTEINGIRKSHDLFSRSSLPTNYGNSEDAVELTREDLGYSLKSKGEHDIVYSVFCNPSSTMSYCENRDNWNSLAFADYLRGKDLSSGFLALAETYRSGHMILNIYSYVTHGKAQSHLKSSAHDPIQFVPAVDKNGIRSVAVKSDIFYKLIAVTDTDVEALITRLNNQASMSKYIDTLSGKANSSHPLNYTSTAFPDMVLATLTRVSARNAALAGDDVATSSWWSRMSNIFNSKCDSVMASKLFNTVTHLPLLHEPGIERTEEITSPYREVFKQKWGCFGNMMKTLFDYDHPDDMYLNAPESIIRALNKVYPEITIRIVTPSEFIKLLHSYTKPAILIISFGSHYHIHCCMITLDHLIKFVDREAYISKNISTYDCNNEPIFDDAYFRFVVAKDFLHYLNEYDRALDETPVTCMYPLTPLSSNMMRVDQRQITHKTHYKNAVGEALMFSRAAEQQTYFVYIGCSVRGPEFIYRLIQNRLEAHQALPLGIVFVDTNSNSAMHEIKAKCRNKIPVDVIECFDFQSHFKTWCDANKNMHIGEIFRYPLELGLDLQRELTWIESQVNTHFFLYEYQQTVIKPADMRSRTVNYRHNGENFHLIDIGLGRAAVFVVTMELCDRSQEYALITYDDMLHDSLDSDTLSVRYHSLEYSRKVTTYETTSSCILKETMPWMNGNIYHTLTTMPTASNSEYRLYALTDKDPLVEFLSVTNKGIKITEKTDAIHQHLDMKTISAEIQHQDFYTRKDTSNYVSGPAACISFFKSTADRTALVSCYENFSSLGFDDLNLPFKVPTTLNKARWHVIKQKRRPVDVNILNDPKVQNTIFKLIKTSYPSFNFNFVKDYLFHHRSLTVITGVAGAGKTHILGEILDECYYITPFASLSTEGCELFTFSKTFEVAVRILEKDDFKKPNWAKYMVLDEAQSMGPLVYYFAAKSEQLGMKLILLGDETQINWSLYENENDKGVKREDEASIAAAAICDPSVLFGGDRLFSNHSYRFGPKIASMVSDILGFRVYGHNADQQVIKVIGDKDIESFSYTERAKQLDPDSTIICLTHAQASEVRALGTREIGTLDVRTAGASGGLTIDRGIVFLLTDSNNTPFPHPQYRMGRAYSAHIYVALTRFKQCITVVMGGNTNIEGADLSRTDGAYTVYDNPPVVTCAGSPTGKLFSGFAKFSMTNKPTVFEKKKVAKKKRVFAESKHIVVETSQATRKLIDQDDYISKDIGWPEGKWYENPAVAKIQWRKMEKSIKNWLSQPGDEIMLGSEFGITDDNFILPFFTHLNRIKNKENANQPSSDDIKNIRLGFAGAKEVHSIMEAVNLVSNKTGRQYIAFPSGSGKTTTCAMQTERKSVKSSVDGFNSTSYNDHTTTLIFGNPDPSYDITVPLSNPDQFEIMDSKGTHIYDNEIGNLSLPSIASGQFHAHHQEQAADLLKYQFTLHPNEDGVVTHGFFPGPNNEKIRELINDSTAQMVLKFSPDSAKFFADLDKTVVVKTLNPEGSTGIIQRNTVNDQVLCALGRYGTRNFDSHVDTLPAIERGKMLEQAERTIDLVFDQLAPKLKVAEISDITPLLEEQQAQLHNDWVGRGSTYRIPDIEDLQIPSNITTHQAKVQMKHADGPSSRNIFKAGQPVQVGDPSHAHFDAAHFRVMMNLLMSCLGPKLAFMGPGMTVEALHSKLLPFINWKNTYGGDIKQCDASHIKKFIKFLRRMLRHCYPNISAHYIDLFLGIISRDMSLWFFKSREGIVRGQVKGQLASGMRWTFFLNCLWTLFNLLLMIIETFPNNYEEAISGLCAGAGGDDSLWSLPDKFQLPAGEYTTFFRVTVKVSREPHHVIFCHHKFTINKCYLDPVRLLAKVMSKPQDDTEEAMREMKESINALVAKYRDPRWLAELMEAYSDDPLKHSACEESVKFLLMIVNTPEKKLLKLLVPQRVRFIYNFCF